MIIPQYFATEQTETSRMPRAPQHLAYTGQGLEAEGLIGLGRALSSLGFDAMQNIINVRSESQFLEGTSQWERAHTEFFTGLAQDQDFDNYGVKYKSFAKSLRRQLLKKGLTTPARRELEKYMENQQVSKEKQVAGIFLTKQRDYGRVSAFESVSNFERAGDYDGAVSAINHARGVGFMSAEEAFARKQDVQANIESNQIQALINTDPESAMEAIDVSTVDERGKNILRSQARTRINQLKAAQMEGLVIAQEKNRDDISRAILAGKPATALIENSALDEAEQWQWHQRESAEAARRASGKEVKVDWDKYGKLQDVVKKYGNEEITKKQAREAIVDAAGKSITESMALGLFKDLDTIDKPDDPMNRSDVKRGLGVFDDLESAEINAANAEDATYEDIRAIRLTYQKKKDEYERWIRGQEDIKETDIQNKVERMTQEGVEEVTLNWFERLMWKRGGSQLFGVVASQEERLVNKKVKKLQELGHWEGLSEDEKETIRQALRLGRTVDDVINLME